MQTEKDLLKKAENGDTEAIKMLCKRFYELEYEIETVPNDLWEIIDIQAQQGHCYANFLMHTKYYHEPNEANTSFEYLKKAITDNTIAEAFLRLGIHYFWGRGVKQDHTLAMHYFNIALSMGLTKAYGYLGQIYLYGSSKQPKDVETAITYLKIGVAQNDKTSLGHLCIFYASNKEYQNIEKAIELAQDAINKDLPYGYMVMGDIYDIAFVRGQKFNEEKYNAVISYYEKAIQKGVKRAYSKLALFYCNDSLIDDATEWARKGIENNDYYSYLALAIILDCQSKSSHNYEECWQCFLTAYQRVGLGAAALARLYLDRGYRPKSGGFGLKDIVLALDISANNGNRLCLEFLMRIISEFDEYKELEPDPLKRERYLMECEHIGAQLGDTEFMYSYGMRLLDKEDPINYKPYEGIEWLEKGAELLHGGCVRALIDFYSKGKRDSNIKQYEKWCEFAIINGIADICSPTLVHYIRTRTVYKEHYTEYLIKSLNDTKIKTKHAIYTLLIKKHQNKEIQLDKKIYNNLIDELRGHVLTNNLGHAKDLMPDLFPTFDPKALERGEIGPIDVFMSHYYTYYATGYEFMLNQQDAVLRIIYRDILNDKALAEDFENKIDLYKHTQWETMLVDKEETLFHKYDLICDKLGVLKIKAFPFSPEMIYPIIPSSVAFAMRKWGIKSLLSLIRSGHQPFNNISITSKETEILNIAEELTDYDFAGYLIYLVEMLIETEKVLKENYHLIRAFLDSDYTECSKELQKHVKYLKANGIEHNLPWFTRTYFDSLRSGLSKFLS